MPNVPGIRAPCLMKCPSDRPRSKFVHIRGAVIIEGLNFLPLIVFRKIILTHSSAVLWRRDKTCSGPMLRYRNGMHQRWVSVRPRASGAYALVYSRDKLQQLAHFLLRLRLRADELKREWTGRTLHVTTPGFLKHQPPKKAHDDDKWEDKLGVEAIRPDINGVRLSKVGELIEVDYEHAQHMISWNIPVRVVALSQRMPTQRRPSRDAVHVPGRGIVQFHHAFCVHHSRYTAYEIKSCSSLSVGRKFLQCTYGCH